MTGGLSVVLVTNGAIGVEVAAGLATLPEVRSLTVVTTRVSRRPQTRLEKARVIFRHEGPAGIVRALRGWAGRSRNTVRLAELIRVRCPGAGRVHWDDVHAPEARAHLAALAPDLGIVAAAYPLGAEVFGIPRLGFLNLHLGRAPEFRGSSPAFYELLQGVPEVGVTIHRVSEALDGGPILAQALFPLDTAPRGDPIAYLRRYQRETLVPNGARMMAEVVAALARGPVRERAQEAAPGPPRRRATWALKRELRRRVRSRRRRAVAVDIPAAGTLS